MEDNTLKINSEDLVSILSDPELSKEKKEQIVRTIGNISIQQASMFSGPVPPPEILKGYNEIIPNSAERMLVMAEKQLGHLIEIENHAIKEELKQSRLGQLFGFILGLVGFGLATFLAFFGHETIAGIFGTTTIVGLVTVFVLGKKVQKEKTKEEK
ncbi:membrane protein [Bacteroidia bacterium]|nr:membrane protein [Bacteroidia bacterium]